MLDKGDEGLGLVQVTWPALDPLPSFCLQVALDGSLVPLPQEQVQLLKARCGRGGLRVLALAYKDMLLQPAAHSDSDAGAVGAGAGASQQQGKGASWELLDGDDDQKDLVLIGLLALEDPGNLSLDFLPCRISH